MPSHTHARCAGDKHKLYKAVYMHKSLIIRTYCAIVHLLYMIMIHTQPVYIFFSDELIKPNDSFYKSKTVHLQHVSNLNDIYMDLM